MSAVKSGQRILGVDVGGTFTDCSCWTNSRNLF